LPTVTARNATLVLYVDDATLIITNPSPIEFANKLNIIFANVNEWFRKNLLFLNFNKNYILAIWNKEQSKTWLKHYIAK